MKFNWQRTAECLQLDGGRSRLSFAYILLLPALAGCASYTNQTAAMRASWVAGNYPDAAKIAQAKAKDAAGSKDAVLWDLEAGATSRAASQMDASLANFKSADDLFDYWDTQAKTSVTGESGALLTNQTVLPYKGTDYDRIMESTYQALNYLQTGHPDEARVELNRALDRQREAVAANAQRIVDAQKTANAAAKSKDPNSSYDVNRAQNDPKFQAGFKQNYAELDAMHFYGPYVNPFTTYLQGVLLMAHPQSASDYESARINFNRVRDMIGSNPYIDADCALAENLTSGGGQPANVTYVIFETGEAPVREEIRIDIPLFVVSRSVPYVGAAFPKLKFNGQFNPGLTVRTTEATPVNTTVLCDMDAVIAQDFKNELPTIIIKTLISTGIKAAAQYGIHEAAKKNDTLNILTEVAGTLYQAGANQADLRTWVTLPKKFTFCRVPTPADHKIEISSQGTGETRVVELPSEHSNLVYVKSTSYSSVLSIQSYTL